MKNLLKRTKCDGIRPCPSVKHFYDAGNVIDYTHMPLTAAHLINQGVMLDDAEVITDMTGSQLNPLFQTEKTIMRKICLMTLQLQTKMTSMT